MEQKCLLGVFAHPDDESFAVGGVLRMYADAGVRTALVCATRGEAGEISDPTLATPETLGQVREQELRDACAILGVSDLTFLDYRDGTLAQAPRDEAVGRLVRRIRRLRPQVVVTFDANGGYGHTDHIAAHQIANQAFEQAGNPACYPEQLADGLPVYAPRKLYYSVLARSTGSQLRAYLQNAGINFSPGGDQATIPAEQMGIPDELITTVIPLTDQIYETKLRAWAAHRTQNNPNDFLNRLPPEMGRILRGTERFVLAFPPGVPGNGAEHDLFAGVTL
ncbi:MAG: PIG-L deacetylase family protein [Chloroflexota bacterium]